MMLRLESNESASGDLELVRKILSRRLRGHAVQVWLFGSRAWGHPVRSSDIDIGILPLKPLNPGMLTEIQDQLDASTILPRVELFDLTRVDAHLRAKVLHKGIQWEI